MNKKKAISRLLTTLLSVLIFAIGVGFMVSAILNEEAFVRSYVFWGGFVVSIAISCVMWKNFQKN